MKILTVSSLLLGSALCAAAAIPFTNTTPPAAETGTVQVKVVWEGEKPEPLAALAIGADAAKGCHGDGAAMDTKNEARLIDANGGVANVVLTIAVKDMPVKVPEGRKYQLDQKACRYEPHVQVVPMGATVEYLNSDAVAHNVHVYAQKNGDQNNSVAAGSKAEQKLEKAEVVTVKCDIHSWMSSYIYVTDDPIYGLTKADGSSTLEGVPAGKYKVAFWHEHESIGKGKSEEVTVEAGKTTTVEIKVGAKKKKAAR